LEPELEFGFFGLGFFGFGLGFFGFGVRVSGIMPSRDGHPLAAQQVPAIPAQELGHGGGHGHRVPGTRRGDLAAGAVLQLGVVGAAMAINISWALITGLLLAYALDGGCPETWKGFSAGAETRGVGRGHGPPNVGVTTHKTL